MLNITPSSKNTNETKTCIVILGMHRSGSSLLTRMINLQGIPLGKSLLPPNSDNPKGFFEHKDIVRYNEDLLNNFGMTWSHPVDLPENWAKSAQAQFSRNLILEVLNKEFASQPLFAIKDPRMCRLLEMWEAIFVEFNTNPKYITIVRHPLEVASSLYDRDKINYDISYLLWLRYLLEPLAFTTPRPHTYVTYSGILQNFQMVLAKIGQDLDLNKLSGFGHNNYAISAEIDENLYRNRSSNLKSLSGSALENHVLNIYDFIQNNINDTGTINQNLQNANNWLSNISQILDPILVHFYNEISLRDEVIINHQEELLASFREIDKRDKDLSDLYNSATWRLTEPIRKLNRKLVKKFQDFNQNS